MKWKIKMVHNLLTIPRLYSKLKIFAHSLPLPALLGATRRALRPAHRHVCVSVLVWPLGNGVAFQINASQDDYLMDHKQLTDHWIKQKIYKFGKSEASQCLLFSPSEPSRAKATSVAAYRAVAIRICIPFTEARRQKAISMGRLCFECGVRHRV